MEKLYNDKIVVAHVGHGSAQALKVAVDQFRNVKIGLVGDAPIEKAKEFEPPPLELELINNAYHGSDPMSGREQRRTKRKNNRTDKFGNKRK